MVSLCGRIATGNGAHGLPARDADARHGCLPAIRWLEFDPADFPLYEALFSSPLEVEDGYVSMPTEPGLDVELEESVIDPYRVEQLNPLPKPSVQPAI